MSKGRYKIQKGRVKIQKGREKYKKVVSDCLTITKKEK